MAQDMRTYPAGVPCWIELTTPDADAASGFYEGLFGWATRADQARGGALIATLDGEDVASIAEGQLAEWMSFVAVSDVDATCDLVRSAGGRVLQGPTASTSHGPLAQVADSQGARCGLREAHTQPSAQVVNVPGAWNFSDLHAPDPASALRFYSEVFGWQVDENLGAGMFRLEGYGRHLQETVDPDIFERQEFAPPGFADVVAGFTPSDEDARWWIRFAVADRDESTRTVERLGGRVLSSTETAWTREAIVTDPQGARFIVSQLAPP